MKLKMLMILVADLGEAKRFYRDVLGFSVKSEEHNSLTFDHKGCDFVAFECDKNASVGDYGNEARSVFVFEVPSVDATFLELKSKGVKFLHTQPNQNHLGKYAAFVDPFGNVHEILEPAAA